LNKFTLSGDEPTKEAHSIRGRALASELYASTISKFISEHQIRSVVDLGCGDFRVAQLFVNDSIDYTGIDIVAPLIAHNEARFASHNVRFLS
jgi:SAM-dependent methyltransferase